MLFFCFSLSNKSSFSSPFWSSKAGPGPEKSSLFHVFFELYSFTRFVRIVVWPAPNTRWRGSRLRRKNMIFSGLLASFCSPPLGRFWPIPTGPGGSEKRPQQPLPPKRPYSEWLPRKTMFFHEKSHPGKNNKKHTKKPTKRPPKIQTSRDLFRLRDSPRMRLLA